MPLVQIVLTLVFYVWLFLVLWLLWSIWRDTSRYIRELQQKLIETKIKTAMEEVRKELRDEGHHGTA